MSLNCSVRASQSNDDDRVYQLTFSHPSGKLPFHLEHDACLRYLSVVDVCAIPLHTAVGFPCSVATSCSATVAWLTETLLGHAAGEDDDEGRSAWWSTARPDSPLGILVAVDDTQQKREPHCPGVTELVIYASKTAESHSLDSRPHAGSVDGQDGSLPDLSINVMALSSDLLQPGPGNLTPPASPCRVDGEADAVFLPHALSSDIPIQQPPVRKRKSAADAFDEADKRRKQSRRRGGVNALESATWKAEPQLPSLKHRRSMSNTLSGSLSRSPSICSSRPPTAGAVASTKRSRLSRPQNAPGPDDVDSVLATKNRDLISRTVMAGMRLYGLSQSKQRKSRARPATPSRTMLQASTLDENEADVRNDEEYKLVYHQAFKGTCFALRGCIGSLNLQLHADAVSETADKLLAVFCNAPVPPSVPRGRS